MAIRCALCGRNIKNNQPDVLFSFAYKGKGLDTVHLACAEYHNNPKEAKKKWNFTKYRLKTELQK